MALQELAKNLELVEVSYDGQKAVLTFLDEEAGLIRTINFNKQSYNNDTKKFVDDPEKAEKVEQWCNVYFNATFDTLTDVLGQRKDIYVYDRFNSLFRRVGAAAAKAVPQTKSCRQALGSLPAAEWLTARFSRRQSGYCRRG